MTNSEIQKRLQEYRELRDAAVKALKSLLENGDVESYSLSDNGGNSQNVKRREISELRDTIKEYDIEINALERQLTGGGIRTFGTARWT